jgi:hypothetical protein
VKLWQPTGQIPANLWHHDGEVAVDPSSHPVDGLRVAPCLWHPNDDFTVGAALSPNQHTYIHRFAFWIDTNLNQVSGTSIAVLLRRTADG